jgi:hypothetical protein
VRLFVFRLFLVFRLQTFGCGFDRHNLILFIRSGNNYGCNSVNGRWGFHQCDLFRRCAYTHRPI